MTLDSEFNALKIEKAELKIGYNPVNKSIIVSSTQVNNYFITVNLPPNTTNDISEIEKRANEVAIAVKGHFLMHPEQLKGLGQTEVLALVNATATATYSNIVFISRGTGSVKI